MKQSIIKDSVTGFNRVYSSAVTVVIRIRTCPTAGYADAVIGKTRYRGEVMSNESPTVVALKTEVERLKARRLSGEWLAALLVKEGIVHPGAVDDSQDYDGGKTMDAIYKVAEALRP